jgi:hypothetical protein
MDILSRIVLLVGSRGDVASLARDTLVGVAGARRHRGDVFAVSSIYEAGQFLAWIRFSQSELLHKVLVIISETALEVDPVIDLRQHFCGKDYHYATRLEGGRSSITTSKQDFLYGFNHHEDGSIRYLWEEATFEAWNKRDPRTSIESAVEWLMYNVQALPGSSIVTMSSDIARMVLLAQYYTNPDEIKIPLEAFYSHKEVSKLPIKK